MLKKIRNFITGLVVLWIIIELWAAFQNEMSWLGKAMMLALVLIDVMILYVIIYYWYGKDHKCPSCGRRFCLKKGRKDAVSKEKVSVLVETKTRNKGGEVIGTQEQYVPGERITYRITYICKKCGGTSYSTYKKDVPKV